MSRAVSCRVNGYGARFALELGGLFLAFDQRGFELLDVRRFFLFAVIGPLDDGSLIRAPHRLRMI